MQTDAMTPECLSFEQLQVYASNSNKATHAQLYTHISTCELCACAVNGFTAAPFVSDDLVAIHHEIDARTTATHANTSPFAQLCIAVVSLVSIFSFYNFVDAFSENKIAAASFKTHHKTTNAIPEEKARVEFSKPGANAINPLTPQQKTVQQNLPKKILLPVETMEAIDIRLPETTSTNSETPYSSPSFNAEVIYIYDLKITDYNNLYFKNNPEKFDPASYTPSFKENKDAAINAFEFDAEQKTAAHSILKKGLNYFNKNKYLQAIEQFRLLLDNNPQDVNALFYSGLAFYHAEKNAMAIKNLEAVLQNANNTFHPEAKWHLALAVMKTDKGKSRQLLTEILNENGFYAKQAEELLREM